MTHNNTTTDNNGPNKPRHKAGSLISRRRVVLGGSAIAAAAGLGIAGLAGAATNSGTSAEAGTGTSGTSSGSGVCTLTAEATEDDYALTGALTRQDIREDKEGVQIDYTFTVVDTANDCAPLSDALVEIWQCDALGEYSGFVGEHGNTEDDDSTWLRGGNITDSDGQVLFTSIWPGHYEGRAVHVHIRVHTDVTFVDDTYSGGTVVHTGELFFDPDINATVQELSPYSDNTTTETLLDDDTVYDGDGTPSGLLTIEAVGDDPSDGYTATLTVGVDTSATHASAEPTSTPGQNSGGTGTGNGTGTGTGTGNGNGDTSANPSSSSGGNQTNPSQSQSQSQSTGTSPTGTVSASPTVSASTSPSASTSASS
ncbi:intradiol ring-cleavage dioxygenase [Streptomyces sp. NBC_01537]|uniref:intradiol ring-cleavage dioxygenase n=1 Tax=Streptomyces sp. NBC_01537 TaxID=2903896 RepID=UPI003868FF61